MKFLEVPDFDAVNETFSLLEGNDAVVRGKIETYSCKSVSNERKLEKILHGKLQDEDLMMLGDDDDGDRGLCESISPDRYMSSSPIGPLSARTSKKTLIYLILTLNSAYPDYDFSSLKAEHFVKEPSVDLVFNSVGLALAEVMDPANLAKLRVAIDKVVDCTNSSIYSYVPDLENDPLNGEGKIWTMNYFFYNQKMKRIVFFSCSAESKVFSSTSDEDRAVMVEDEESYPNMKNYDIHVYGKDSYIATEDEDFEF